MSLKPTFPSRNNLLKSKNVYKRIVVSQANKAAIGITSSISGYCTKREREVGYEMQAYLSAHNLCTVAVYHI